MATPSPARPGHLHSADWINAAFTRLSNEGIEAVRVEVLARDLGVSKGSFYWHFRDRSDLLEKMLGLWEADEISWLDGTGGDNAATRWAHFVARTTDGARIRREVALRAWARQDEHVATRVAGVDRKRAGLIAAVLRDVGFARIAAEEWSEVVLLVALGWIDRAARDRALSVGSRGLGEFLSDVILAASSGHSPSNR